MNREGERENTKSKILKGIEYAKIKCKLTIEIPEEYVLIKKVELEELKEQLLAGVYWNMKDLEKRVSKKQDWIKENILYQPRFKNTLKEFVYYPQSQGQSWSFQANKMAKFLDENFDRIFSMR